MSSNRRSPTLALALGLVAALAACSETDPYLVQPTLAPIADSPRRLVHRFVWKWEHRDTTGLELMLGDSFVFAFASFDSAGNAYQDREMSRREVIDAIKNLLARGTPSVPPADHITFGVAPNLVALPDSRPGKVDPWHKEITTIQVLDVDTRDAHFKIRGSSRFFVVRGDSAGIRSSRMEHASERWLIERWEDGSGGSGALPGGNTTIGVLLALYRRP